MNIIQHARMRAMGMGELGSIDLNSIIGQGFSFGNKFLEQWGNRGAYRAGINPNGTPASGGQQYITTPTGTNNTQAAIDAAVAAAAAKSKSDELASGSINSKGVKIGGSLVTWPTIGIGVAAFMLLQSRGFEKRR